MTHVTFEEFAAKCEIVLQIIKSTINNSINCLGMVFVSRSPSCMHWHDDRPHTGRKVPPLLWLARGKCEQRVRGWWGSRGRWGVAKLANLMSYSFSVGTFPPFTTEWVGRHITALALCHLPDRRHHSLYTAIAQLKNWKLFSVCECVVIFQTETRLKY